MSISKRDYFILVDDPSDYPLAKGTQFDKNNLEAMLSKGSFTPGTVLERDGKRFAVEVRGDHRGSKYITQEMRAL